MKLNVKIAIVVILIVAIVASVVAVAYILNQHTPVTLRISSTTSLHDTGLEEQLIAGVGDNNTIKTAFEAKYPWITLQFTAEGTGKAIAIAQRGDADMIMVHSPSQENTFLTNGYGVNRKIFGYNFFLIVGPESDPAGIKGMAPVAAMQQIYTMAQGGASLNWVSRNDSSGTATKEASLWTSAGQNVTNLRSLSWFWSTTGGMGLALQMANTKNAYILTDVGTYLAYYGTGTDKIQLQMMVGEHKDLLNVYSAIVDNPQNPALNHTHFTESMLLVNFLVSSEGQTLIQNFGSSLYDQSLFKPFVPLVDGSSPNATLLGWIKNAAYLSANQTECPLAYRYNAGSLYDHEWDNVPTGANIPITLPVSYTPTEAQLHFGNSMLYQTDISPKSTVQKNI